MNGSGDLLTTELKLDSLDPNSTALSGRRSPARFLSRIIRKTMRAAVPTSTKAPRMPATMAAIGLWGVGGGVGLGVVLDSAGSDDEMLASRGVWLGSVGADGMDVVIDDISEGCVKECLVI